MATNPWLTLNDEVRGELAQEVQWAIERFERDQPGRVQKKFKWSGDEETYITDNDIRANDEVPTLGDMIWSR